MAITGTKCIDLTDRSRKEVLGKNKDEYRRLHVRFYYPGEEDLSREPVSFLRESVFSELGIDNPDLTLYHQRVKVFEDLRMKEGNFPLILFSHGYGAFAEQNSDLCSYLARNGYIVASIAHTYEASEVIFEDGTMIGYDPSLTGKMTSYPMIATMEYKLMTRKKLSPEKALTCFERYQKRYRTFMTGRIEEWAEDDRFVLSCIHEMARDSDSFLYQKIDFSNGAGSMGHSFGGAAAYHDCLNMDEVSCGINMDGALTGEYGDKINHKPFMQMISDNDLVCVSRIFLYHDKPVHFLAFKDMAHLGFTDLKLIPDNEKLTGTSDPVLTMDTLNEAVLAFFERYLRKGDTDNRKKLKIDESFIRVYGIL